MTRLFKIALPDGSVREMPEGSTPADVAAAIGPGLAKAALAARIDGELRDLNRPFEGDGSLALVTSRDEKDALDLVRHDFAHVLAEAVQNLFPGTQITFGPSTDDGFYYDFSPPPDRGPFTDEDLRRSREEMRASSPATSHWFAKCGPRRLSAPFSKSRARHSRPRGDGVPEGERTPCTGPARATANGWICAAGRTSLRLASSTRNRSS